MAEFTLTLMDKVTAPANKMAASVQALNGKLGSSTKALDATSSKLTDLGSSAGGASSGMGGLQAELAEMTGGLSIVVEALGAVAVGFGAVVLAGAAMAIEANEAKQKMLSLFDALGEGKISGAETVGMLDQLGDRIGQTRAQLAPIAQGFLTLGITGKEALNGLTLAAASAGAMAEGGAQKFVTFFGQVNAAAQTGSKLTIPFKKLEKQLAGVGLNIGDIAKRMNMTEAQVTKGLKAGTIDAKAFGDALQGAATDKGAGPLARAGASLTNVWSKFQENIMKMFESIDVGPFLEQVKDLFDIFGQGKASGQALTAGIGGFFKQVFALATKVVPYIKHFLLDLVILGLKAYIGVKPIIAWLLALRQNTTVVAVFWTVMKGLGTAALVVGVAIGAVIAVVVGLALALVGIQVAIVAVGGIILGFVASAGQALMGWAASAAGAAVDFVSGLVKGISAGAGAVVDAVKGVAKGGVDAFKNALGIHSPSKVMMELGGHTATGFAQGIDNGQDKVQSSAAGLSAAAASGAAGGSGGGAGGGSGAGVTVTVEPGAIVISGGSGSAMDLTEQAVSLLFERIALSQGLGA